MKRLAVAIYELHKESQAIKSAFFSDTIEIFFLSAVYVDGELTWCTNIGGFALSKVDDDSLSAVVLVS